MAALGERLLGLADRDLYTPVVCIEGLNWDKLPSRSVNPPRVDKLVNALRASGLANNWANGRAETNGLAMTDVAGAVVVLVDVEVGLDVVFSRFAFWSSMLWDRIDMVKRTLKGYKNIFLSLIRNGIESI